MTKTTKWDPKVYLFAPHFVGKHMSHNIACMPWSLMNYENANAAMQNKSTTHPSTGQTMHNNWVAIQVR